ncbi:MAG: manganese efflux pump [Bacteroidales bacterium]|nr:manganese efflux pump [Bacteroidales bacterium]
MTFFDIILLSIGLAMDCLAVSVSTGIGCKQIHIGSAAKMPVLFGLFQGLMPLIGFFVTIWFADFIGTVSHWIALAILSVIGLKMIWEDIKGNEEEESCSHFSWATVILLAVATSIDALSTGIIFVSIPEQIVSATIIIGITSFLFSIIGLYLGYKIGKTAILRFGIIGGIILIGIGIKIVAEHYL